MVGVTAIGGVMAGYRVGADWGVSAGIWELMDGVLGNELQAASQRMGTDMRTEKWMDRTFIVLFLSDGFAGHPSP